MSDLIVALQKVIEVKPHPNADRLEIAVVLGWEVITQKGNVQPGDTVLYVPPDAMLPKDLADQWGVTPYLSWMKSETKGRVRAASIRSYTSYGFTVPAHKLDIAAEIGEDVKAHFGIDKYEPPERLDSGDAEKENFLFHRYTDIQRIENFPDVLIPGEEVVATEKLHGTNSRVGIVVEADESGEPQWVLSIGSHDNRRKLNEGSLYYVPVKQIGADNLVAAFNKLRTDGLRGSVILFGEVYGGGVQGKYVYGSPKTHLFRAFDLAINGKYVDYDVFLQFCAEHGIMTVPELYRGPYDMQAMKELSRGASTLDAHIREGIVVKPVKERYADHRVIYKFISPDYETKNDNPDSH